LVLFTSTKVAQAPVAWCRRCYDAGLVIMGHVFDSRPPHWLQPWACHSHLCYQAVYIHIGTSWECNRSSSYVALSMNTKQCFIYPRVSMAWVRRETSIHICSFGVGQQTLPLTLQLHIF